MFIKRYEEETNLRCYLMLDTSSSMNFPDKGINKLQFSIYAIASLMYLFKKQRDAFGLCSFSDKIDWISPVNQMTPWGPAGPNGCVLIRISCTPGG